MCTLTPTFLRGFLGVCTVQAFIFLNGITLIQSRVSPFSLKKFFAYKRNKANVDPFHMCFTISL